MEKIFKSQNYNYINLRKAIFKLSQRYSFLKLLSIGKSCLGKDIIAIKLGNAPDYALFSAAFHGSEHITTNVLMLWLENLCDALQNQKPFWGLNAEKALFGRGIILIPRVNPDGCDVAIEGKTGCGNRLREITKMCGGDFEHFNANIRGVDINHNFNAGWEELKAEEAKLGIIVPNYTRFGGYSPESEPETVAICNLCRTEKIRHILALHSQGRVIYWSYKNKKPKRSRQMAEIMATSSGYSLDYATGIAEGGGFKDWFIDKFDKPGFTVEIGKGENPLPINTAQDLYKEIAETLILSAIM